MEYIVLYTHQKTKKAKTWQDGILSVVGHKGVLYDDKRVKLDSMYIKPEAVVKGEQIESDRFYIQIEDVKTSEPATVEPVKPVTCPVRVPVRTGLKRKRSGFVPPRVVRQPDTQQNDIVSVQESCSANSYLDMLKRSRQNPTNHVNTPKQENVLQLYSITEDNKPLEESSQVSMSTHIQSPFTKTIQNNIKSSPVNYNNTASVSPLGLGSPWSSYGTKAKPLEKISPYSSQSSVVSDYGVGKENDSKNLPGVSNNIMRNNNYGNEMFKSSDLSGSERQSEFDNAYCDKNSSPAWPANNAKFVTDRNESNTCNVSSDQSSKRSMKQIMALLGKQTGSKGQIDSISQSPKLGKPPDLHLNHATHQTETMCNVLSRNDICDNNDIDRNSQEDLCDNFSTQQGSIEKGQHLNGFNSENISLESSVNCHFLPSQENNDLCSVNLEFSPLDKNEDNVKSLKNDILTCTPSSVTSIGHKFQTEDHITGQMNIPQDSLLNKNDSIEKANYDDIEEKSEIYNEDRLGDDTGDFTVSFGISYSPLSNVSESNSLTMESDTGNHSHGKMESNCDNEDSGKSADIMEYTVNFTQSLSPFVISQESYTDEKMSGKILESESHSANCETQSNDVVNKSLEPEDNLFIEMDGTKGEPELLEVKISPEEIKKFQDSEIVSQSVESEDSSVSNRDSITVVNADLKQSEAKSLCDDHSEILSCECSNDLPDSISDACNLNCKNVNDIPTVSVKVNSQGAFSGKCLDDLNFSSDSFDLSDTQQSLVEETKGEHHGFEFSVSNLKEKNKENDKQKCSFDNKILDTNEVNMNKKELCSIESGHFDNNQTSSMEKCVETSNIKSITCSRGKQFTELDCDKINETFESDFSSQLVDVIGDDEYRITDNISQNSTNGSNLSLEHLTRPKKDDPFPLKRRRNMDSNNINRNFSELESYRIEQNDGAKSTGCRNNTIKNFHCANERSIVRKTSDNGSNNLFLSDPDCDETQPIPYSNQLSFLSEFSALQHPEDLFNRKMKIHQDHTTWKTQTHAKNHDNKIEEQLKDIRYAVSEKLEGYKMRGSVVSGAARRGECSEEIEEEENFYIDFDSSKPSLRKGCMPLLSSKYNSSPAQFVPKTPELGISTQNSGCQSSEDDFITIDSASLKYEDDHPPFDRQTCKDLSYSQRPDVKQQNSIQQTDSKHRKLKTPLISAPYEDIQLKHESPASIETNEIVKNEMVISSLKHHGYADNTDISPKYEDLNDITCDTAVSPKYDNIPLATDQLTYWEKKLVQRQKCGNIFIKNDDENSQEEPIPFTSAQRRASFSVEDKLTFTQGDKNRKMERFIEGDLTHSVYEENLFLNQKNKENCNNNLRKPNVCLAQTALGQISGQIHGSKWGKYECDLNDDDNDFLAFDSTFSVPVDKGVKTSTKEWSLRPPTVGTQNVSMDDSQIDQWTEPDLRPPTTSTQNMSINDSQINQWTEPDTSDEFICTSKAKSRERIMLHNSPAYQSQIVPDQTEVDFSCSKLITASKDCHKEFLLKPKFAKEKQTFKSFHSDFSTSFLTSGTPPTEWEQNISPVPGISEETSLSRNDYDNTKTNRRYKCPMSQLTSYTLKGSKRNLGAEIQFPSLQETTENSQPTRDIDIPITFVSLALYKQVFTAALKEHLNIILFDLGVRYHHALAKIDTTSYLPSVKGKENKGSVNNNPVCKCGAPSKMVQVKKSGPNHNRFFYACNGARNSQCKFFQWADSMQKKTNTTGGDKLTMSDPSSITTFVRSHHVHFYCDSQFIKKSTENIMTHFKRNVPNWVKQKMGIDTTTKKKMYIQLSRKDSSGLYSKDDLWIISRHLDFRPSSTILCKSTYYGPTSGNEVEIEPISSFSPSNWSNEEKCHAILAGNVSGELSYLTNLEENITLANVPVLTSLLNSGTERTSSSSFSAPVRVQDKFQIYVPENYVDDQVEEMINQYKLNEDQSTALLRVARMFTHNDKNDILLIHGVFGAGKSFLLSVVVVFLVWLFEKNDTYTPGVPLPWKLVIASTTNVAVDRILNGLLALGFEDFVRVGSVKKISKPVLPYSVHSTGSDSQELKDLQMMLRSGELTNTEKQNVRQSIEKHRLGENKKKLGKVRVVGVTCASCSAVSLKDMQFPIVLLDECSQMTEPASMLPVAKFQCQKLVLVGDPKQLDPTIQGSESTTEHGLEQTIFDRLILMGHDPVMLHTQYRCHPHISGVSNSLFYNNQLNDGVLISDRPPSMEDLPALCFYDVADGREQSDSDGSFYNEKEAEFIVYLIKVLIEQDIDPYRIGVISLYKSQMYKIVTLLGTNSDAKEFRAVMVSTVDAFQGGERDVIILSCVRTKNVGFIDNEKRTNVALTRAKHHLLIVGNENNLSKNKLWRQIIQCCKGTSINGLQKAEHVRDRYKLCRPENNSRRKPGNKTASQESTSPPMSLSDSGRTLSDLSGLSSSGANNTNIEPELVENSEAMPVGPVCRIGDYNTKPPRRKRRRIDASLLDIDDGIHNSSEDENLPVIFDS